MRETLNDIRERVQLRPAVMPDDEPFLQKLYAETRDDLNEFLADPPQLRQLLQMQYHGQNATYSAEFPNATDEIILLDGQPVGRLMLDHRPDSIHGVDIAVLKSVRNLGVGTAVLLIQFEGCSKRGLSFTLSVVKNNPARRLYERLGCRIDGDNVTHYSMTWRPDRAD